MKTNADTRNPIKLALENRSSDVLPSGFNARMMERVRQKAESRRRRNRLINWISLISASLLLVVFGVYVLFVQLKFTFNYLIPKIDQPSKEVTSFYWYIAILVAILLGLDYWMRLYHRKPTH